MKWNYHQLHTGFTVALGHLLFLHIALKCCRRHCCCCGFVASFGHVLAGNRFVALATVCFALQLIKIKFIVVLRKPQCFGK